MKLKLAEALLRRKELDAKQKQLYALKTANLFEVKAVRKQVTDNVDDIVATVPKLEANQVTAEYDFYARQLRLVDAAIQQANWTVEIEVADTVLGDYVSAK
jgi:ABC-type metal ion transport system substrate-binding protein